MPKINTLFLAVHAKRRAEEFLSTLRAHKKRVVTIALFETLYDEKDLRHAFLRGFLAALEELRRDTPTKENKLDADRTPVSV
jgi:hypothetical protein